MIQKNIEVPFEKLEKVFHVADIHIRNLKRHKEYKEVFRELYKEIKKDTQNAIIYVGGDVAHQKVDLSPELVDLTSKFFKSLADILPTIVITGNHDCNLNNPDRLDALGPIIENLNYPNLHYLKDSGIYTIADTDFVVFSIFDEPGNYITSDQCKSKNKIALYHGVVDGSLMDNGMKLRNDRVNLNHFRGYDIGMLGDIHRHQFLNDEKSIAYVGSLIQQNHGENHKNHGIIKWDVLKQKGEFIDIKNNYGFYTLHIKDEKIPDVMDLPKYPRMRIKIDKSLMFDSKRIVSEVKKKFKVKDVVLSNANGKIKKQEIKSDTSDSVIGDIKNVDFQNELIKDYLLENFSDLSDDLFKNIFDINKELNEKIKSKDQNIGILWKLKTLEFSNLYSYGEDNFIDFTKMSGVQGLFAPNIAGKSSIMEILLFALYDKSYKIWKSSDMINVNKKDFYLKLNFELNGEDYFIEKKGKKRFSKQINDYTTPVEINFWKIDSFGNKQLLNGDDRRYTKDIIHEYFGTIDNAILTSFSLQNNHTGLISKKNSERKSLLSSFLGIDVFSMLYDIAHKKNRDIRVLLKSLENKKLDDRFLELEDELMSAEKLYFDNKDELSKIKRHKGILEKNLIEWNQKLMNVRNIYNIKELNHEKNKLLEEIKKLQKEKKSIKNDLKLIKNKAEKIKKKSNNYNENDIRKKYNFLEKNEKRKKELSGNLEKLEFHLEHQLKEIKKIESIEYDPNCKYCVKNKELFFGDSIKTEENYKKNIELKTKILEGLKETNEQINKLKNYREKLNAFEQIQILKQELLNEYTQKNSEDILLDHKIQIEKNKLNENEKKIEEYYQNQKNIENNRKVKEKIDQLQQTLNSVNNNFETLSEKVQKYYSDVEVVKNDKKNVLNQIDEIHDYELKNKSYEYYLKATHRNGIPNELIKKVLPIFEIEINNILSQLVDFTVNVSIQEKYVNFKIVYGDIAWSLEASSGSEKFIASLAIRHALIKISNLPKPNFLFIDEGWGNLDSNNLSQLYVLFNYLKGQYDIILIISHIDSIKDVIDDLLSISKSGKYSYINNTT